MKAKEWRKLLAEAREVVWKSDGMGGEYVDIGVFQLKTRLNPPHGVWGYQIGFNTTPSPPDLGGGEGYTSRTEAKDKALGELGKYLSGCMMHLGRVSAELRREEGKG